MSHPVYYTRKDDPGLDKWTAVNGKISLSGGLRGRGKPKPALYPKAKKLHKWELGSETRVS